MINFRFHLISLIAVFLALAVGVVMGYGVLGQPTLDTLQNRVDTVEARADAIRSENSRLRAEADRLQRVLGEVDDFAVTSRLVDAGVVAVAVRGVDADAIRETITLAETAGAVAPGIVWLEDKWALRSDDDASELAEIIGVIDPGETGRAAVREAAAAALATRLATGPDIGRPDLLAELAAADFVSLEGVDGMDFVPAEFDGRVSRVLLVGGTAASMPVDRGILPLTRALVRSGRLVVVADEWREVEDGPDRGDGLAMIRDDAELSAQVSTVDNFDVPEGPLTAVLALADRGQGTIGHYGLGAGAERIVPAWWGM